VKAIRFVRHAQSLNNAGNRYHRPNTPLSELGWWQAEAVAARHSTCGAQAVVVGTMTRAFDTAWTINARLPQGPSNNVIYVSDLFVERRQPGAVQGQSRDDPEVRAIVAAIKRNYHDSDFRYSDEETFADLRDRARRAVEYLERRPEDNLIVVTHGIFLRMMLASMMFGEELTSRQAMAVNATLRMPNTGVSEFIYDAAAARSWRLISWGGHEHLTGRLLSF